MELGFGLAGHAGAWGLPGPAGTLARHLGGEEHYTYLVRLETLFGRR
jgi:hypothetical protein